MAEIFISYSSHDRLQALSLAEKLRLSGYDAWIDQHRIQGATRWGKEIVQAINGSKLVAVLISSSSLLSENVMKELNLAAEKHKQLLPIMLEDTELTEEFAYHLAGVHHVAIENTESILKALEQLKLRSSSGTDFSPSGRTEVSPTASKDVRLAILPFDDLSPLHDNEWFADGMLDELITTLGALEHMKVPSRTDVMYYKKHHPKAQEIASDLNVRYLVGGSVRKAGEKIRITASLTDAFNNQQLWTNHYDGSFDDIFDLQEKVSKEITETLKLRLTTEEKKKIEEQPTVNAEAYELYLRGNEWQWKYTREGYEHALELYKQAIVIDSKYFDAYIGVASVSAIFHRECSREPKWLHQAETYIELAESLSGETAKTLWIRGEIALQKNLVVDAENFLLKSIKLDPQHYGAYNVLGNLYMKESRYREAADAFEKVIQLQEGMIEYYNLLVSLSLLGDTDQIRKAAQVAIPVMEKHLSRNTTDLFAKVSYAFTLHWAGNDDKALSEANKLSSDENLDGMALYNLGCLYDSLGFPVLNLEMAKKSVEKGFRDLDAFRVYSFDDPKHTKEFETLIMELQTIIEREKSLPN
jgi:adenylate cyclase